MKANFEKDLHITNELMYYCHSKGAREFHSDVIQHGAACEIRLVASPVPHLLEDELDELKMDLNAPRMRDMEQNFWGLGGESENFEELALVGMMCDEVAVEYKDEKLEISIKRFA